MQSRLTGILAIMLAMPVIGCSYVSGFLGSGTADPQSAAYEALDDQKCQSTGYQLGTPAYTQCRHDLDVQRAIADRYQPTPSNAVPR